MDKKSENTMKKIRTLTGVVTNVIDDKTAKIRVERRFPHPKYGKIVHDHRNYLVHIPKEIEVGNGDIVTAKSIKQISKRKSWEVISKIESK